MRPCTARPGPPPGLEEAPGPIRDLFLAWLDQGRPWRLAKKLEEALWKHRNTWLIAGAWVFYLTKSGDPRESDVIRVVPRSMPFPKEPS